MTSYENLYNRLIPDTNAELQDFIARFKRNEMPQTYSAMERHFEVAKKKPEDFKNHGSVLAISFGGSNTKIMIASMRGGRLYAEYIRAQENPKENLKFYDYLDQIIYNDPVVDRYLRETPCPEIGVSIPMMLIDDCPLHPTKIPSIDGFIARSRDEIGEKLQFSKNFDGYMKKRGYQNPYQLFYQSDGIVAHHGAVSLSDVGEQDKTVLCICGTGMANGDELHYLPIALICNLPEDDELFPPEETENRQLHYAIAGKGLFSLMRRVIDAKIRLGDSALAGKNIQKFFQTARDTRNVFEICQSAYGLKYDPACVDPIKTLAGEDGFEELQMLSKIIVKRVYETLSNAILATMISMGALTENGKYIIYLEGSIARNPVVKSNLFEDMKKKIKENDFVDFNGNAMNIALEEDPSLWPVQTEQKEMSPLLSKVDTTLIGTATMIMAQCSGK